MKQRSQSSATVSYTHLDVYKRQDTQFPLFNKEMTRAECDSKVQENPLNDHLKVAKKQPEEKEVEYDIGMGYLGNGLTVWNRAVEAVREPAVLRTHRSDSPYR